VASTCGYGEGLSGSINAGKFLTSYKVYWLASQEGLCSMEYVSKYREFEKTFDVMYVCPSPLDPMNMFDLYKEFLVEDCILSCLWIQLKRLFR
jgi:hypothetical protein